MRVLLLGGTGIMGKNLSSILSKRGIDVTITSRYKHESSEHIFYKKGDAHNPEFVYPLLAEGWDAIVDFLVYSTDSFSRIYPRFLESTNQYIYVSSCRIFDNSDILITENSPRLLDTCIDSYYIKTDEYGLKKARQEDLLVNSGSHNYTIVRPYLTYDKYRIQLCAMEKEKWLYRALTNRKIVVSEDILSSYTTMTSATDVAYCIDCLIGNVNALGEDYNLTCSYHLTWKDVLLIYTESLRNLGYNVDTFVTQKSIEERYTPYQVKYDRKFNRRFDNSKIQKVANRNFVLPQIGLNQAITQFCSSPLFKAISWFDEGIKDRIVGQTLSLRSFSSFRDFFVYFTYRYGIKK